MQIIDTLILGATVFAAAYATQNTVSILDAHINVGYEFTDSFKANPCTISKNCSVNTNLLSYEMRQRKILNKSGNIHILPVSGILAERIVNSNTDIDITANVLSIKSNNGLFDVLIANHDGIGTIYAHRIIDTTLSHLYTLENKRYKKYISAILINGITKLPNEVCGARIIESCFNDECYLKLPLENNDDTVTARKKLFDFWVKSHKNFNGYELASVSPEFSYEVVEPVNSYATQICKNMFWIPSALYDNVLESYEEGIKCNLNI